MRTVTPITLVVLILAFLSSGCRKPGTGNPSTTQCLKCPGGNQPTLSAALLTNMTANYRENQHRYIVTNTQRPPNDQWPYADDAQSIWFSLDSLKSFICQIEAQTKGTATNQLGVRIYYAAYPAAADFAKFPDLSTLPETYAHRHTLFMIPTLMYNGRNTDFDPFIPDTRPSGRKDYANYIQQNPLAQMFVMAPKTKSLDANSEQTARNHGDLIPPPSAEHEIGY